MQLFMIMNQIAILINLFVSRSHDFSLSPINDVERKEEIKLEIYMVKNEWMLDIDMFSFIL